MVKGVLQTGIIDADVHPWIEGDMKRILPYMGKAWHKHFDGRMVFPDHPLRPPLAGGTSIRRDAAPPNGGKAGSDPHFMVEDLLDKYSIKHAILSSVQAGKLACYPNANESSVLASAFNDFFIDQWLSVDQRYKLAMVVAVHDPKTAAKEIHRIGDNEGIVAVFMPLINILMGNSYYYPIYEAAEEYDLPILIHPTGTEGGFSTSVEFCGGVPTTYIERHTVFPEVGYGNIASMVLEGVFVRYPKLKLLASEFGYSWLPGLAWRMDQNWRNFRIEVPWLHKAPSEYIFEHIRITSQPLEEPEKPEYMEHILEMIHAEKTLLFSTDYPHWDNDFPKQTLTRISEELKQRIFHDNAAELFGLD